MFNPGINSTREFDFSNGNIAAKKYLQFAYHFSQDIHIILCDFIHNCLVLNGFSTLCESQSTKCFTLRAAFRHECQINNEQKIWMQNNISKRIEENLCAGETAHIIANFALPPKDSCNKNVNLESRYGMCLCFPDWETSARIFIKFLQPHIKTISKAKTCFLAKAFDSRLHSSLIMSLNCKGVFLNNFIVQKPSNFYSSC